MAQKDDSIFPEAGHMNGTSEVGMTGSTGVTEADPPAAEHATEGVGAGLRPGFLAELAVAMRATAEKERERISAKVADDATAHVDKVRARAAIETDELKRLAEEDVQHIEDWSASEMERIRAEADQKIQDRRTSLDEYLQQHDSIIDTEIEGVNAAVRDYNTTLDRYFEELAQSDNPAAIVARAEALPPPPDLDEVRAKARGRAVAMFADQDEPIAEAAPLADETPVAAPMGDMEMSATQPPEAPVAEAIADQPAAADDLIGSAEMTDSTGSIEGAATPVMDEATAGEAAANEAANRVEATAPAVVAETVVSTAEAEPIPVMDPAATASSTWPAATSEPEPEPVAASVDHTSAAVRLLRSVAPWTAPTHSGSNDRSDAE
jgi:hypothetical protein